MARSELIRDFENLMKKVQSQKNILVQKLDSVDAKKAVLDENIYESFMPTIDAYQDEIGIMLGQLSHEIQDMSERIIEMLNKVEAEADKLLDESPDEAAEEESEDEEFTDEEKAEFQKELEEDAAEIPGIEDITSDINNEDIGIDEKTDIKEE